MIRADDSMARDDDRQGIPADCGAYGSEAFRVYPARDLFVGNDCAIGRSCDLGPDLLLKSGPNQVNFKVKLGPLADEVFIELAHGVRVSFSILKNLVSRKIVIDPIEET